MSFKKWKKQNIDKVLKLSDLGFFPSIFDVKLEEVLKICFRFTSRHFKLRSIQPTRSNINKTQDMVKFDCLYGDMHCSATFSANVSSMHCWVQAVGGEKASKMYSINVVMSSLGITIEEKNTIGSALID